MSLLVRTAREAVAVVREHRAVTAAVLLYVAAGYLVQALFIPDLMRGLWHPPTFQAFLAAGLCAVPVLLTARRLGLRDSHGWRMPGGVGWRIAWLGLRNDLLTVPRVTRAAFVLLLVPFFLCAFGRWKLVIDRVHPYAWDARLSDLDAGLHLGHLPWRILQPILGHPPMTRALDITYVPVVVGLLLGVTVWQAWSTDRALRQRFLLTFVLAWIVLGTVVATVLSSAGPCYYGRVTGLVDPYAGLMAYLHGVDRTAPLTALAIQQALWSSHVANTSASFSEISAMPSIHVAMPALFTLTGWQADRRVGTVLAAFAGMIFLGSVHLGWHYAVDGYAGASGVALIWWLAGRGRNR